MIKFGYRCEEERYQPSFLLQSAIEAENLGFDFVSISDHFHPWYHKNGAAGHAWVWMGAAAGLTKSIVLGTGVTVPSFRYHPAIVAQAFATLGEMFPERIVLGVGSGEAMNEIPLGFEWPQFEERLDRLKEAVRIIKLLWNEDFVSFEGKYYRLRDANLYTKPKKPVPLYMGVEGPKAAKLAGNLADGVILGASSRPDMTLPRRILAWVEEGAKEAGRDMSRIPARIEIDVSYDRDYDEAFHSIGRWAIQGLEIRKLPSKFFGMKLYDPRIMDTMAERADLIKFAKQWVICTDVEDIIKEVEKVVGGEFREIDIRSVSPHERAFLTEFGKKALPYLRERYGHD
jgi:coenzyme F420-dependent glucose-6-phosphate dehydrogenase